MTSRARPAVALLLVALTGTMLWWPVGVAAAVPVAVVPLALPTTTRTTMLVATGHTYQFQVRATNRIGMASTFKIGLLISV